MRSSGSAVTHQETPSLPQPRDRPVFLRNTRTCTSTTYWCTGSSRRNDFTTHAHNATCAAPATLGPLRAAAHTLAPFFIVQHHPRLPRSARASPFSSSGFSPPSRPAVFPSRLQHVAQCPLTSTHAPVRHACARTHARTHTHGRPTANDATRGPPAWLTGRLHGGGIRSVRSPPRQAPLLATPIATPLQGGRPERPGLLFLELLSLIALGYVY